MSNTNGHKDGGQPAERDPTLEEAAFEAARAKRAENLLAAHRLAGQIGPNGSWIEVAEGEFKPDQGPAARLMARVLSPLSSGEQPEYTIVNRGILVAHGAYPAYVAGGIPTYQAIVLLENGQLLALRGAHVAESRPDRWVVAPFDPNDSAGIAPRHLMDDNLAGDGLAWNLSQGTAGPRLDLAGELPDSISGNYWQRYVERDVEGAIAAGLETLRQQYSLQPQAPDQLA